MIVALTFDRPQTLPDGRVVRARRFVPRSSLPASAACLVANGAREQLSRLLAMDLETEVSEPAVLAGSARDVVFAGGFVYRVRGHGCDAFVALRAPEAKRLAAAAFGELDVEAGAGLSVLERATLERLANALTALCAPLCGAVRAVQAEVPERAARESETYFEVRTGGRVAASIGFALTRDPAEPLPGEPLTLEELQDVEIPCRVEFARGAVDAKILSRLAAGTVVALDSPLGARGTLFAGELPLLAGVCGIRDDRRAFAA
jgi:flagellar motor switch/type III secretory pathway protein FliN